MKFTARLRFLVECNETHCMDYYARCQYLAHGEDDQDGNRYWTCMVTGECLNEWPGQPERSDRCKRLQHNPEGEHIEYGGGEE